MDKEYKPYQPNEMWGEPGTRSFHNDAAKFFREVMKLKTPIQANNTPKCSAVREALLSVPREQAMTDMLFDMSEQIEGLGKEQKACIVVLKP